MVFLHLSMRFTKNLQALQNRSSHHLQGLGIQQATHPSFARRIHLCQHFRVHVTDSTPKYHKTLAKATRWILHEAENQIVPRPDKIPQLPWSCCSASICISGMPPTKICFPPHRCKSGHLQQGSCADKISGANHLHTIKRFHQKPGLPCILRCKPRKELIRTHLLCLCNTPTTTRWRRLSYYGLAHQQATPRIFFFGRSRDSRCSNISISWFSHGGNLSATLCFTSCTSILPDGRLAIIVLYNHHISRSNGVPTTTNLRSNSRRLRKWININDAVDSWHTEPPRRSREAKRVNIREVKQGDARGVYRQNDSHKRKEGEAWH